MTSKCTSGSRYLVDCWWSRRSRSTLGRRSRLSALPPPTASGVRVAGDQFQWLIAWVECLRMYLDQQRAAPNPIVEVELEASDGMNLDDVVVRRRRPPHTYMQVKYAVDARDLWGSRS